MKTPKPTVQESETQSTLLSDLELIRTLLDRPPETAPAPEDRDDVPMLEDMVEGALSVSEGHRIAHEAKNLSNPPARLQAASNSAPPTRPTP